MSLQNIIFYKKTGNINDIIRVLPDLGSLRKEWSDDELLLIDIVDWSGMYKPWYKNGLYKKLWDYYDIMNLSENFGEISNPDKNLVESIKKNIL